MEDKRLHELLSQYQPGFQPGFSDRVMSRLASSRKQAGDVFMQALDALFPKVSGLAFATLALMLILAYAQHGSLDIDQIVGLDAYQEQLQINALYPNNYYE